MRGGPVARGGGGGGGGADGALQFYSEGFSKGGIPGMNFHVPHMKWLISRVHIVLLLISPTPLKQARANIATNDSLNQPLHHTTFPVFF